MQRLNRASMRILITCSAVLLMSILFVTAASAHAHIESSTPSDGEVLTAEPSTVSAVYGEETSLTGTKFEVSYAKDASSTAQVVAQGAVDVNDRTKVSASLPAGLGDGIYSVKWHTLTEDDNGQVDGTFSFTVASGGTASGSTGQTGSEQEQPEASELPATGQPDGVSWLGVLLVGVALLGSGLVVRRRAAR